MSTLPRVFSVNGSNATIDSLSMELNNIINTWNNHDAGLMPFDNPVFNSSVWWDVRAYGAVGDGTTDDKAAIQRAINAASTAGGGIVFIPPQNFAVGNILYVPSEVSIIGCGMGASTISALSGTFPIDTALIQCSQTNGTLYTTASPGEKVLIRDIKVDCTGMPNASGNGTGQGIFVPNISYFMAERVHVKASQGYGIHLAADNGTYGLISPHIVHCLLENCGKHGTQDTIGGGNNTGAVVAFNVMLNPNGTAIDNVHVENALWIGNRSVGASGHQGAMWSDFGMVKSRIAYNYIENGSIHVYGFLSGAGQGAPTDVVIEGNYIQNGGSSAIFVAAANQLNTDTGKATGIRIIGNRITDCIDDGIVLQDCPNAVVVGNSISSWNSANSGTHAAITLAGGPNSSIGSTGCVISGNSGLPNNSTLYYYESTAGQTNGNLLSSNNFGSTGTVTLDSTATVSTFTIETPTTAKKSLTIKANNSLIIEDGAGTPKTVTVKTPSALTNTWTFTFPTTAGSLNQYLTTDGAGVLTWTNAAGTGTVNSGTSGQLAYYASSTNAVSGLTLGSAYQVVGINSGATANTYLTLAGTTNQVNIATSGTTVTFSTPQNIDSTATPTFASETLTATSNQLILGTTRTVTITAPTPATSSRTHTIPDVSASANFVLDQGTYTLGGTYTFSNAVTITPTTNQLVLGTTRTLTISAVQPASSSRTWTVPDISGNGTFAALEGTQTFSGAKTFSSALTVSASSGNTLVVNTTDLVVDSTDHRVGIGTASPSTALHILAGQFYINGAGTLGTPGTGDGIQVQYSSATGEVRWLGFSNSGLNFMTWYTAASGVTALRMTLGGSGGLQLGAPTGGDKGSGTLNVATDIFKNNTAYTNPDYVLEHWSTGRMERFKGNDGANSYEGILPLVELEHYMKENLDLPGVKDRFRDSTGAQGIFARGDIALEKLEEAFIYISQLHNRITNLEKLVIY